MKYHSVLSFLLCFLLGGFVPNVVLADLYVAKDNITTPSKAVLGKCGINVDVVASLHSPDHKAQPHVVLRKYEEVRYTCVNHDVVADQRKSSVTTPASTDSETKAAVPSKIVFLSGTATVEVNVWIAGLVLFFCGVVLFVIGLLVGIADKRTGHKKPEIA